MNENFKIDVLKDYKTKFETHLKLIGNHRIIFSGIFGSGKTTFLKDFFEQKDVLEDYITIHLFPVNYSVATNEDIFELLKFDIFLQLLGKTTDFEEINFGMDETSMHFILKNYKEILLPFLNFIPSVGGNIYRVSEKLLTLQTKFEEFNKEIQIKEKQEIIDFINNINQKKGSIYETDFYTELIISVIKRLKSKEKEVVLILDDLDRIDPEHIFRLLNVFAAHVDVDGKGDNDNKFGFNKVILVCDIDNIRNIYSHKYGIDTDFNGYIDKFSTNEVFHFEIGPIVEAYLEEIFKKVKSKDNKFLASRLSEDTIHFRTHLIDIISAMLISGSMSLRKLITSCVENEFYPQAYKLTNSVFNYQDYNAQLYDFLLYIYGGHFKSLISAIQRCKEINIYINTENTNILGFLTILEIDKHKLTTGTYEYMPKGTHDYISYSITRIRNGRKFYFYEARFEYEERIPNQIKNEYSLNSILNHFDLMERTFFKIRDLKNSPRAFL